MFNVSPTTASFGSVSFVFLLHQTEFLSTVDEMENLEWVHRIAEED